jgi:hypothetical protein
MEFINELELALEKTLRSMDKWHNESLTWFDYDEEENDEMEDEEE